MLHRGLNQLDGIVFGNHSFSNAVIVIVEDVSVKSIEFGVGCL